MKLAKFIDDTESWVFLKSDLTIGRLYEITDYDTGQCIGIIGNHNKEIKPYKKRFEIIENPTKLDIFIFKMRRG